MSARKKSAPRFRVGDWVTVLYGPQRVLARVVEDRGRLGVNRRRLYRIHLRDFFNWDGTPTAAEVPEEELEAADAPDRNNEQKSDA